MVRRANAHQTTSSPRPIVSHFLPLAPRLLQRRVCTPYSILLRAVFCILLQLILMVSCVRLNANLRHNLYRMA